METPDHSSKEASFRVYIDESGDEGFVFLPDGTGSSRWLVISAVIVRKEEDIEVVKLIETAKKNLGKAGETRLHFRNLKHEQRLPLVELIGKANLDTISILVDKQAISECEKFQANPHLLYRYICRFLIERVSWCCRKFYRKGQGNGMASLIFSNRSCMSYEEIRSYLVRLKTTGDVCDVQIDWKHINPEDVSAIAHERLMGLQIADAVASSFYFALRPTRFGHVESRYVEMFKDNVFRRNGSAFKYGVKIWPGELSDKLKDAPYLEWLKKTFEKK